MRRFFPWVGIILRVIVILLLLAGASLYALSGSKLGRRHVIPQEAALTIPNDSATIARGAYLVTSLHVMRKIWVVGSSPTLARSACSSDPTSRAGAAAAPRR